MLKIVALISALIIGLGTYSTPDVDFTTDNSSEKLVVYTNAEFAPFEYISDSEIVGIDIDICQKIADEMGVELEIVNVDFDSIIGAIASGKGHIGASGFTITEERKNVVDFSVPYYSTSQYMIVPKGSNLRSADDLKGKKIAVQTNSTADFEISNMNIEGIIISRLTNINEAVYGLGEKYDAIVTDEHAAKNIADVNGLDAVKVEEFYAEEFGLVINKNNKELLEIANKVINEMLVDGSIAESFEYHTEASAYIQ